MIIKIIITIIIIIFMSFINPTGFFDNPRPRVSNRSRTVSAFFNQFDAVSS